MKRFPLDMSLTNDTGSKTFTGNSGSSLMKFLRTVTSTNLPDEFHVDSSGPVLPIEGSNMIFHSLTFAKSRGKC